MKQRLVLPALSGLALAVLAGALAAQDPPAIEDFEFDVTTLDGTRLTQEEVKDKVLLIDFWGTWCTPCRAAIPHLVRLHDKYKDQGFEIVGLCYEKVPEDEALNVVRAFAAQNGINYPLALGTDEIRAQVPNFGGFPTMLFFKRGLEFDHLETGFPDGQADKIEGWIKQTLADAERDGEKPAPPLTRTFDAEGGGKLVVGDGSHHLLIVLVHPKARPTEAQLARLQDKAKASDGKLEVVLVSRDDLPAQEGVLRLHRPDLEVMYLGKAFPAYRLYAPSGKFLHREVGIGDSVIKRVLDEVTRALAPPPPPRKDKPEDGAKEKTEDGKAPSPVKIEVRKQG